MSCRWSQLVLSVNGRCCCVQRFYAVHQSIGAGRALRWRAPQRTDDGTSGQVKGVLAPVIHSVTCPVKPPQHSGLNADSTQRDNELFRERARAEAPKASRGGPEEVQRGHSLKDQRLREQKKQPQREHKQPVSQRHECRENSHLQWPQGDSLEWFRRELRRSVSRDKMHGISLSKTRV